MVCIRQATERDLLAMQRCNLLCLPENYQLKVRMMPSYCIANKTMQPTAWFYMSRGLVEIMTATAVSQHHYMLWAASFNHSVRWSSVLGMMRFSLLAVLSLPLAVMASAAVPGGGLQWQGGGLCACKDVSLYDSYSVPYFWEKYYMPFR